MGPAHSLQVCRHLRSYVYPQLHLETHCSLLEMEASAKSFSKTLRKENKSRRLAAWSAPAGNAIHRKEFRRRANKLMPPNPRFFILFFSRPSRRSALSDAPRTNRLTFFNQLCTAVQAGLFLIPARPSNIGCVIFFLSCFSVHNLPRLRKKPLTFRACQNKTPRAQQSSAVPFASVRWSDKNTAAEAERLQQQTAARVVQCTQAYQTTLKTVHA